MRTLTNSFFHVRSINSVSRLAAAAAASKFTPSPAAATVQRSLWHSPVPYLFGGLAAMLGLITFAIVVLACSYWRHTSSRRAGLESGGGAAAPTSAKSPPVLEEKFMVIMAGEVNPTFLATPCLSSKASSLNDETGEEEKETNPKKKTETTPYEEEQTESASTD